MLPALVLACHVWGNFSVVALDKHPVHTVAIARQSLRCRRGKEVHPDQEMLRRFHQLAL